MDKLLVLLSDVGDARIGGADSYSDRLNCKYTVFILAFFTLMVTARQYVKAPISCWCPKEFSSSHVSYVDKVCWTNGTYYLPFEVEDIANSMDKRHRIGYYQWVPLMLICQAILFYVPRALWRAFNAYSGIAVHTITDAAIESQSDKEYNKSDKLMGFMVRHTGRYLKDLRRSIIDSTSENERCRRILLQMRGSYLTVLYMIVKLVYLGNIIGQSFLLNVFLGTNYHLYGIEVIRKMTSGQDWTTSDRFPRVTLCDVEIRRLGNIHRHTVQCTLPMNLLNEIFFIFLWFWFAFVGLVTIGSLIVWLINSVSVRRQTKLVRGHLYAVGKLRSSTMDENKKRLEEFVTGYLRRDGCFILRMVSKNASDVIAAELTSGLWDHYNKTLGKPKVPNGMDTIDGTEGLLEVFNDKHD